MKKMKKAVSAALSALMLSASVCSTVSAPVSYAAGDKNYAEALALSLYFFDSNECGTEVDDNPLTWRGNCHTYDAKAALSNAVNFNSAYASLVDPDGDGYVDVSGGYHDAGDHVKFHLTNGFAGASLAMSYYLNEGAYAKAGCEDHLFEILKKICDYLMKTTFLNDDGSVATICYNVSDDSDHSYWQSPEIQTYDRKTYWLTSSKNNSVVCGEMASALAGTAYVLKASDPDYSAKCMKYAKAIYDFGNKYTGNETAGMGSMYPVDSMYQDEMAMAGVWFYLNGEGSLPDYKPTGNGCYNNQYYDYHLYCYDKVWSGYATMMYKITGDNSFANEMQFELNNKGGCPTSSYNAAGWGASRYNCALQMVSLGLANGDASSSYAQGAKYQMDHILGDNSRGYSFLVGYGDKWPTHIHHRAANPGTGDTPGSNGDANADTAAKYTNYGMLVGGDDSSGNYLDSTKEYQFTEPALDYNSCFALACAGLVNLYGGDASAVKDVIKNASEINENYVFNGGSGNVTPPDTTTTTTTTTTTETTTTTTTTEIDIPDPTTTQTIMIEPERLHLNGKIDSIDQSAIVINGVTYKFAYDSIASLITEQNIQAGDTVDVVFELMQNGDIMSLVSIAKIEGNIIWGDANDDGTVDVADVVAVAAYVGNPDSNKLQEKGLKNADVHSNGNGITADDALAIQQYLAKIVTALPIQ
ncbi:MAG: glycoside hydrolase family 9 protein [Oscillospiraceae bacterium]|nr:glycoside hydrolase family 9 protein [Oscillospiraceae bacterium]